MNNERTWKFKKEIKILIFLVIAAHVFDMVSTYFGSNGEISIILEKEINPLVTGCVARTQTVIPCLLLSKIIGIPFILFFPLLMVYGVGKTFKNYKDSWSPQFLEPLVSSLLIYISINGIFAGLTWYGVKIGLLLFKGRSILFSFIIILGIFCIEHYRWKKRPHRSLL